MTLDELKIQIDHLSDKIDLINSNLQFNITTFLAIMSVALVIAGGALILLVKNIVNKRFNEEIKNIDKQRDKKIEEATNNIEKNIIKLLNIEHGLWTPELSINNKKMQCVKQKGKYYRQDDLVHIDMEIHANLDEQSFENGIVRIDGLPFICSSDFEVSCSIGGYLGIKTNGKQLTAIITLDSIGLFLSGESSEILSSKYLLNNVNISISGTYKIM